MTDTPLSVIDLANGVAPWRQVRDQLALLIAGDQLAQPTCLTRQQRFSAMSTTLATDIEAPARYGGSFDVA
jgi:hypothetical protein